MGKACSTNGEKWNAYVIGGKATRKKRPLGKPRRGWMHNIKMDPGEIGWGDMDSIYLSQNRDK
jgi:hypothetical protein